MKTNKTKTQKGQSLVEFAISLTVIMILLAGAVEFGIALFQYVQLRDAAQEGALYGSLNPTDTAGIVARVRAASDTPINLQSDPNVTICTWVPTAAQIANGDACSFGSGNASACEGAGVQVQVSFPHQISMPFVSAFIGSNTIPINVSVTDTILLPTCP